MAHVAELPGCFAIGSTASKAAGGVPAAITGFLAWLRLHKEPLVPEAHVVRPSMADLFVAEIVTEGAPVQAGSRASLWEFDKVAWDDERLERAMRWLGYSRADLLARIEGTSDADMSAKQVAGGRTLLRTLAHIANAEYGYVNRVAGPLDEADGVSDEQPGDARQRLAAVRALFQSKVREIPTERRGEIIYPLWAERPDEPWTVAKAMRRALEHEREHLFEI